MFQASTNLFFKPGTFFWCHCVGLRDQWNNIHFIMKVLHKFNIEWFQSGIKTIILVDFELIYLLKDLTSNSAASKSMCLNRILVRM